MSLADLRQIFKEDTGNYSYTNTQIDRFLNRGIKLLDSITFTEKKDNRLFIEIPADTRSIVIPSHTRVIRDVWVQSATLRKRLVRVPIQEMREKTDTSVSTGMPTHYSTFLTQINANTRNFDPIIGTTNTSRQVASDGTNWRIKEFIQIEDGTWQPVFEILAAASDEGQNSDLSFYLNWGDVTFDSGGSRGIIVYPIPEQAYYLELFGSFQTPELTDTVSENWWTMNYASLVSLAAQYSWDVTMRNISNAKDLLEQINLHVFAIIGDAVEEEFASIDSLSIGD